MSRLFALVATLVALSTGTAVASTYTAVPGPYRPNARFVVTYRGVGFYNTVFHAHPPNPGGADDSNDARDSSAQAWDLRFRHRIALPACGPPAAGGSDPCVGVAGLSGAIGATTATGEVRHVHVDGLYRVLDRTVTCRMQKRTTARTTVAASIAVRYLPASRGVGITASSPVGDVLTTFPAQCPEQGDSIDRIADFYAVPGFSFAGGYGAERWFTSREVLVPASVLHRSARVTIPLAETPAGTPPADCAVADPSFERCATGGSWDGVLTLSAVASKK